MDIYMKMVLGMLIYMVLELSSKSNTKIWKKRYWVDVLGLLPWYLPTW
jgi:hypothetical protein